MIPTLRRIVRQSDVTPEMTEWAQACHEEHRPLGHYWGRVFGSVHVVARNEIHTNRDPKGAPGISLFTCPTSAAEGVDVSDYQCPSHPPRGVSCKNRAPIDWAKVAAAGKSYVWIKATEGATGDGSRAQHYTDHWLGAGKAGLLRAPYHYLRMTSSPADQARNFLSFAEAPDPGMLRVVDVETADKRPLSDVARAVGEFLDALGEPCAFYTYPNFWGSEPAPRPGLRLWIAHYDVFAPKIPPAWAAWDWWQYTATGRVPGIPGNADLNRYRGSLAEMLAGGPASATTPAFDLTTTLGVQRALNRLGTRPPLVEDGILGPKTKAAVRWFQRLAGLDVDGIVGPHTRAAMLAALG